jgi:hypothetical protein
MMWKYAGFIMPIAYDIAEKALAGRQSGNSFNTNIDLLM